MAFNTRMPVVFAMACSLRCFLLFGLPFRIVAILLLLRMMHRAGGIGADLVNGANIAALRNDGLCRELAHLELGSLRLILWPTRRRRNGALSWRLVGSSPGMCWTSLRSSGASPTDGLTQTGAPVERSLIAALMHFGLDSMTVVEKQAPVHGRRTARHP